MFCPGIFWGLLEPNIFLGFRLLPTFDHPRHLKSGVPPSVGYHIYFLSLLVPESGRLSSRLLSRQKIEEGLL